MNPEYIGNRPFNNQTKLLTTSKIMNNIQYVYENVSKNSINYMNNQRYIDDQFVLAQNKEEPWIKVKRLSQIYKIQSSLLADLQGRHRLNPTKRLINNQQPTYLSQLNMLSSHHYFNLIQPNFINDQGFYYVTIVREGVIVKMLIDDKFYYDERNGKLIMHPELQECVWVHILIKAWAKIKKGYDNILKCKPFQFIRSFSFPDWQVVCLSKQKKQDIINRFAKANKKLEIIIGQIKNIKSVSMYGFVGNSASFQIVGYYQQFGQIYVKIKSYTFHQWNKVKSSSTSKQPQQYPKLQQNQFIMPYEQFINIFHIIYATSDKYISIAQNQKNNQRKNSSSSTNIEGSRVGSQLIRPKFVESNTGYKNKIHHIHYNKYILNNDARQTNAIVLCMEVQESRQKNQEFSHDFDKFISVGLSIYFPTIRVYDLVRNQHIKKQPNSEVVPYCKLVIGQTLDSAHNDANYVESVKQKMLYHEQNIINFVTHAGNHQYVVANYFKGYANELVHNLYLKPGRYLMRLKIQQKVSEYRCFINTTTINGNVKIYDPKINQIEQVSLLKDCLFKKAAKDKKFITFIDPAKRGSWISCRDEYQNVGYSYIAVHVVINAVHKIQINVSPTKLKQNGYLVKGHKHTNKSDYSIIVDSDQNTLIVIKYDKQWKGAARIWPPPGIQFFKIPRAQSSQ